MRVSRLRLFVMAIVIAVLALPAGAAAPRRAPAFTLALLDGTTVSLADLKGSAAILLFWTPW